MLIKLDSRIAGITFNLSLLLTKFRKEAKKHTRFTWAPKDVWSQ